MLTNKDIEVAYKDCAEAEMQVLKAEQVYRTAHAKVLKARQALLQSKDRIRFIHEEISEPIEPLEDYPDSIQLKTT